VILVTGASGFIGQALTAELVRRGIAFRAVSRRRSAGMFELPSIDAATNWSEALNGVETVVHLAARVHVLRESAADPLAEFRAVNVETTVNLARQAARAGVKRFIFISTIKVNGAGTAEGHPFTAEDPPCPVDDYGRSKAEAEAALMSIGGETGMEIVVIRPPLVYGPDVGANFAALIGWAKSGVPSIFARIENRRSFVYVGNLCDLIIRTVDHPAAAGRTFLVSDGTDLSTDALLRELMILQGRRPRGIAIPAPVLAFLARVAGRSEQADRLIGNLQVDIAGTRDHLDWTPPVTWREGLQMTVEEFKAPR